MLRVLFFARLRETLGCASLDVPYEDALTTPAALRDALCREHDDQWREALNQDNLIVAINQVVAGDDDPLRDGDEVAFYPPVTGG